MSLLIFQAEMSERQLRQQNVLSPTAFSFELLILYIVTKSVILNIISNIEENNCPVLIVQCFKSQDTGHPLNHD